MLNRILSLLALAVLTGFLGILFIWVKRLDLSIVILITLAMAYYDMAFHSHKKS